MAEWVLVFYTVLGWPSTGYGVTAVVPMGDEISCRQFKGQLTSEKPDRGKIDTMLECRDLKANPLKLKATR